MKIIVPMAGRGSRFQAVADQNPEYKKPKPLINVKGELMVVWALKSLPFVDLPNRPAKTKIKVKSSDLVFIALQEHEDKHKVSSKLKRAFGKDINVILIPEVTRGAVETVMTARKFLTDEDVLISDSDHFFDGTELYKSIVNKSSDVDGIIPVFPPPDADVKWSYTLYDKDKTALTVAEKDPVLASKGAYANIGGYYFSSGKMFADEADKMMNSGEMYGPEGKQEFFVAPMYQRLISNGKKIKAAILPEVWGLGTPKDLEYFLKNYKGK